MLTREPVALCPFCQSDADWPDNILVVYLSSSQSFVQNNTTIEVEGVLEIGSHRDGDTGFISQLRLRDARFRTRNSRPKQGSCMNGLELQDILLTFPEGGREAPRSSTYRTLK